MWGCEYLELFTKVRALFIGTAGKLGNSVTLAENLSSGGKFGQFEGKSIGNSRNIRGESSFF